MILNGTVDLSKYVGTIKLVAYHMSCVKNIFQMHIVSKTDRIRALDIWHITIGLSHWHLAHHTGFWHVTVYIQCDAIYGITLASGMSHLHLWHVKAL